MLIQCPKCHFQQPEDQYCAKCGIDMQAFKPPQETLIESASRKPFLIASVALFFVIIGSWMLFPQVHQNLFSSFTPKALFLSQSQNKAELASEDINTTKDFEANSEDISSAAASVPAVVDSGIREKPVVIVTFVEAGTGDFKVSIEQSEQQGQFLRGPDLSAGLISNSQAEALIKKSQVLFSKEIPFEVGSTLNWYAGSRDQQNQKQLGFWSHLDITDFDGTNLKANLEVQRFLRDPAATTEVQSQMKSLPAVIEISQQTSFVMTKIIPDDFVKQATQGNYDLTQNEVFKIIQSKQFAKGQSDLVIIIGLKRKTADADPAAKADTGK